MDLIINYIAQEQLISKEVGYLWSFANITALIGWYIVDRHLKKCKKQ